MSLRGHSAGLRGPYIPMTARGTARALGIALGRGLGSLSSKSPRTLNPALSRAQCPSGAKADVCPACNGSLGE